MDISISLPLDSDGFLRRECPHCEREFKWHDGPTAKRPDDWIDPPVYWCPLCGEQAEADRFHTPAQVEYIEQAIAGYALEAAADELDRALRGLKAMSFKRNFRGSPDDPLPMIEPNDMFAVQSPCHPWEPVKVSPQARSPFYCLACGSPFEV